MNGVPPTGDYPFAKYNKVGVYIADTMSSPAQEEKHVKTRMKCVLVCSVL